MAVTVDTLLAGPRGRAVLLGFAHHCARADDEQPHPLASALFHASFAFEGGSAVMVGGRPRAVTPAEVGALLLDVPLLEPAAEVLAQNLVASVDSAMYWQEPNGDDLLAARPELHDGWVRVAEWVAPVVQRWAEPMAARQWQVEFDASPIRIGRVAADVRADWLTETRKRNDQAARERPADLTANWSGEWWSSPPQGLAITSGELPGLAGPSALWLVEDSLRLGPPP